MKKQYLSIFSLVIILAFILFMIYDTVTPDSNYEVPESKDGPVISQWKISGEIISGDGPLTSVSVSENGSVFLGGDAYISGYNAEMKKVWDATTAAKITSVSVSGDTVFASTQDLILLFDLQGKLLDEWGPFEDNAIITSLASNRSYLVFADAGNRMVFVLTKDGRVRSMMGQSGEEFIIPSPYFDVTIDKNNNLFIANPGRRRIETRTLEGDLVRQFGSPGTSPDAFCGCCNPSHFTLIPEGFITAEKGINRIKILDQQGNFKEFVSSDEKFENSIPLDIATSDGITLYAANPADSKLYIFKRK